jgi:hypothetical protein
VPEEPEVDESIKTPRHCADGVHLPVPDAILQVGEEGHQEQREERTISLGCVRSTSRIGLGATLFGSSPLTSPAGHF